MLATMHGVQDTIGLYAKALTHHYPTCDVPRLPRLSAHSHVGDCQLSLWRDGLAGYGGPVCGAGRLSFSFTVPYLTCSPVLPPGPCMHPANS